MQDINDRLAMLERQEEEIAKVRANKIPFYLEIQLKKNKERLKAMEYNQKFTFKRILIKDHDERRHDWKDEFCLYWTGFLTGEYKNISDYLKRKNFS